MNYYDVVGWKNRSEGKVTKISAERLNHMDNQILANANAIGNVEKVSSIGDGTLSGAVSTLNNNLAKKQDKLTNPLTKSNVVNNLTTTTTNVPLSAYQGFLLANGYARDGTKFSAVNLKTLTVPLVSVSAGSWTQASTKHGLNTSKIVSVTPYVDGDPKCGVTHCWIDGEYVKWNVSNYSAAESAITKVTVGVDIRFLS